VAQIFGKRFLKWPPGGTNVNTMLVVDTFCEVYDLIKPQIDLEFWDFATVQIVPGATYIIGREQFRTNLLKIRSLVESNIIRVFLCNPAEGSDTLRSHCIQWKIDDLVKQGKIPLIGGGDMDSEWPHLQYDSFLPRVLGYNENLAAIAQSDQIYSKTTKPYKFLFLNGRTRTHRKYLLEAFDQAGLLSQSLWTNLDASVAGYRNIQLFDGTHNLMTRDRAIKTLPPEYEFESYKDRVSMTPTVKFAKHELFNNTWGEIYLNAAAYIDTYFSVVTETVFEYPYSFRTEKIWKPIAMGHPWIAVANQGYYRDLRNLGFKTFDPVIDESFDSISNSQERIERISQVIQDLCSQDLVQLLSRVQAICKYNQQHLAKMSDQVQKEFPNRFIQFIK
jgi:hypothetical protein